MGLNARCQGSNCTKSSGDVKPVQTCHGVRNLCESCHYHEMRQRKIHNYRDPKHPQPVEPWTTQTPVNA